MLTAESEKRIIDEIKNVKNELNRKIESKVRRLDEKIENVATKLSEKMEDVRKELNSKLRNVRKELAERIEWTEFRLEGLYSVLKVHSLRTPTTRVRNLPRRAIPDVSGINSTRFKWTSESLF